MDGILKVAPNNLTAKASEFDNSRIQIMNLIEEMKAKTTALTSSWEGEASQLFQQKFAALNDDIEYLNGIIIQHVSDLNELANIYQDTSRTVLENLQSLPEDIIK